MEISPATPADIPALAALLGALFDQEEEFAADRAAQVRGLEAILADPQVGLILVARHEGRVVGLANLLFTVSTALGARVALLDDFVVDPVLRGQGTGTALLEAALAEAKARGCRRISLNTDAANSGARRLYRRFGFTESTMVTMKRLLD